MPKNPNGGWRRLVDATRFSAAGLRAAWRHEEAFRQEAMLAIALTPLAIWLGQTALQRALLIGCLLLILIVELLNSGIEAVVDRIGNDIHELSGQAKDMGSAAVLMSLLLAAGIWAAIAWDRFGPG